MKSYLSFFVEGHCNEAMQNMLSCLKKAAFDDKACVAEILSYNSCMERAIVSIFTMLEITIRHNMEVCHITLIKTLFSVHSQYKLVYIYINTRLNAHQKIWILSELTLYLLILFLLRNHFKDTFNVFTKFGIEKSIYEWVDHKIQYKYSTHDDESLGFVVC